VRKADNLTTILCRCHEIWESYLPGTLWTTSGLQGDCFTFTFTLLHYRIFMKIVQKFSRQKWLSCWLHLCNISFHMSRKSQNLKRRKIMNITFLGAFCYSLDCDNKTLDSHAHNIHHSPFTIHRSPFTVHHSPFTIRH
jgi:hypothetical protein